MGFSSAVASPFGLRPVRYKNGTPWTGAYNWYFRAAAGNAIGMFEPVATTGTAHATTGMKQVARYVAGNPIIGVAVGFLPAGAISPAGTQASLAAPASENYEYCPGGAGTLGMWIAVVDDPNVIFQCQANAAVAAADIGLNADLIAAADCNTTTGLSVSAAGISTKATTATLNLKILGLSQLIDGSNLLSDTYPMLDVLINAHELAHGTGMTGI